jgi:hypothetical protein
MRRSADRFGCGADRSVGAATGCRAVGVTGRGLDAEVDRVVEPEALPGGVSVFPRVAWTAASGRLDQRVEQTLFDPGQWLSEAQRRRRAQEPSRAFGVAGPRADGGQADERPADRSPHSVGTAAGQHFGEAGGGRGVLAAFDPGERAIAKRQDGLDGIVEPL